MRKDSFDEDFFSLTNKKWSLKEYSEKDTEYILHSYEVSPLVAKLLSIRKVNLDDVRDLINRKIVSYNHFANQTSGKRQDNEFFLESYCKNSKIYKSTKSNLVYLHSYAGHGLYGGYSRHIEEKVKFKYPNYINKKNFLG